MSYVDLHAHTRCSDGTDAPAELVRKARDAGLSALALTDHDTVAGVAEAADEAAKIGLDFVAGIELSASYPRPGSLHILGLGVDPTCPALHARLAELVEAREARNVQIADKLASLGLPVSYAHVKASAKGAVVGRPHFAKFLVDLGVVSHPGEAFRRYLGSGGAAYFDKDTLTGRECVALIRAAGGVAAAAHPVQLQKPNLAMLREAIKGLADDGMEALEVIHSDHRASVVAELEEIADAYGLLKVGGSDYHGAAKKHIQLGWANGRRVPRAWYEALRERLANRAPVEQAA